MSDQWGLIPLPLGTQFETAASEQPNQPADIFGGFIAGYAPVSSTNATAVVTGTQSVSSASSASANGGASVASSGASSASSPSSVSAIGSAFGQTSGTTATSSYGAVTSSGSTVINGSASVSGSQASSAVATVIASGTTFISATASISGSQSSSFSATLYAAGSSIASVTGSQSVSDQSNVSGSGQVSVSSAGAESTAYAATVIANGGSVINVVANVTTIEALSEYGLVSATGTTASDTDASVAVDGAQATAYASIVTAESIKPPQRSSSGGGVFVNPSRRFDGRAKVSGLSAYAEAGSLRVLATINGIAQANSVSANAVIGKPKAQGIHNLTDDELLIILAA